MLTNEMINRIHENAAARYSIDLDAIIDRKCAYNATRPYRHGKRM